MTEINDNMCASISPQYHPGWVKRSVKVKYPTGVIFDGMNVERGSVNF